MAGTRTNERPGTRAVLRHYHMSATKARQVLDLIRDVDVLRAQEILASTNREAASVVAKVLASAVANAVNNDSQDQESLYVATAYADEGTTMRRFRPRARGRASRIRKRSCHVTIVVARMDDDQLAKARATRTSDGTSRARRVAGSRRRADQQSHAHRREVAREEAAEAEAAEAAAEEAASEAIEHEGADGDDTDAAVDAEASAAEADESDGADATDEADADTGGADASDAAAQGEDDAEASSEEHED